MSWDVYGLYFDTLCKNYEDLVSLKRLSDQNKWMDVPNLNKALIENELVILVTDVKQKIVHATQNMVAMNGYLPHEVKGRRPTMFQGADTNKKDTFEIRKALKNQSPFEAVVLNYKKDGTAYNCWIKGGPIFDTSGELVNFIAYEKVVA